MVNGKVQTLKTMTWPPEKGVTKAPRLGDAAGQRASFLAYTRAFSAGCLKNTPPSTPTT